MKNIIYIFTILIISTSCGNSDSLENKETLKNKKEYPTVAQIIWKDYDQVLFLLSNKYQIDTAIAKPLIIEYLRIHDPFTYFKLTMESANSDSTALDYIMQPRESVRVTIERLSIEYSVDNKTLSSFMYDFIIYNKLLNIEDECNTY